MTQLSFERSLVALSQLELEIYLFSVTHGSIVVGSIVAHPHLLFNTCLRHDISNLHDIALDDVALRDTSL